MGVDTGLALVSQRTVLYLNLLRRFCTSQTQFEQRVSQAISGGEWDSAEREAHTLKGIAAQVGAESLAEGARRLEQAIRDRLPGDDIRNELATLARPLNMLLQAITVALGKQD